MDEGFFDHADCPKCDAIGRLFQSEYGEHCAVCSYTRTYEGWSQRYQRLPSTNANLSKEQK